MSSVFTDAMKGRGCQMLAGSVRVILYVRLLAAGLLFQKIVLLTRPTPERVRAFKRNPITAQSPQTRSAFMSFLSP